MVFVYTRWLLREVRGVFSKPILKSKWYNANNFRAIKKADISVGFFTFAPPLGLEPRTPRLTVLCSNQLS